MSSASFYSYRPALKNMMLSESLVPSADETRAQAYWEAIRNTSRRALAAFVKDPEFAQWLHEVRITDTQGRIWGLWGFLLSNPQVKNRALAEILASEPACRPRSGDDGVITPAGQRIPVDTLAWLYAATPLLIHLDVNPQNPPVIKSPPSVHPTTQTATSDIIRWFGRVPATTDPQLWPVLHENLNYSYSYYSLIQLRGGHWHHGPQWQQAYSDLATRLPPNPRPLGDPKDPNNIQAGFLFPGQPQPDLTWLRSSLAKVKQVTRLVGTSDSLSMEVAKPLRALLDASRSKSVFPLKKIRDTVREKGFQGDVKDLTWLDLDGSRWSLYGVNLAQGTEVGNQRALAMHAAGLECPNPAWRAPSGVTHPLMHAALVGVGNIKAEWESKRLPLYQHPSASIPAILDDHLKRLAPLLPPTAWADLASDGSTGLHVACAHWGTSVLLRVFPWLMEQPGQDLSITNAAGQTCLDILQQRRAGFSKEQAARLDPLVSILEQKILRTVVNHESPTKSRPRL